MTRTDETTFDYRVFPDVDALAEAAAAETARILRERAEQGERPVVSLTGGTAGVRTAAALAGHDVPWEQTVVHFGDERFVPVDDPQRNDGQIDAVLLDGLDSAPTVVRWPARTELADDVVAAAEHYADAMEAPQEGAPMFDVHLLGMGGEGHVNSVFPDSEAVAETTRLVTGVRDCPKAPAERMTYTLPAVRRSRHVFLVVAGEDKAEAVARAAAGEPETTLPAAGARGLESTVWFLDTAAASALGADAAR